MDEPNQFLPRAGLQTLIDRLNHAFDRCLGPVVLDGIVQMRPLSRVEQLPAGHHDHQAPGSYRMTRDDGTRQFDWANGPQALKPLLFTPEEPLWRVDRDDTGRLAFTPHNPMRQRTAVIGARACDLAALRLQDQHFLHGEHPDPYYGARRDGLFLVAVDCSHPTDTCFCASSGDGPGCGDGADIVLTELDDGFLLRGTSDPGRAMAASLGLAAATTAQRQAGRERIVAAAAQQRALPDADLSAVLFARQDHPQWARIADRCLACGNCTAVCPTCFCHRSQEDPVLGGSHSEHLRLWDSCFSPGHAYLHGAHLRESIRDRYRQWLTHKFGGWVTQYGRSGCTGCGRCISWCPVGIDVTAELAALTEATK